MTNPARIPVLGWTDWWPDRALMKVVTLASFAEPDLRGEIGSPCMPHAIVTAELATPDILDSLTGFDFDAASDPILPLVRVPVEHRTDCRPLRWLFRNELLCDSISHGEIEVIMRYERPGASSQEAPALTLEVFDTPYWRPLLMAFDGQGAWPDVKPFFKYEGGSSV